VGSFHHQATQYPHDLTLQLHIFPAEQAAQALEKAWHTAKGHSGTRLLCHLSHDGGCLQHNIPCAAAAAAAAAAVDEVYQAGEQVWLPP
jgi:hypothetical protein